jgi:hypothetical protein
VKKISGGDNGVRGRGSLTQGLGEGFDMGGGGTMQKSMHPTETFWW